MSGFLRAYLEPNLEPTVHSGRPLICMYAHAALRSSAIMTLTRVPPCVPQVHHRHRQPQTGWWHDNSDACSDSTNASPKKSRAEDWQTGWWQDYSDACSESTDATPKNNRENERYRHGLLGGRHRHGDRGGHDKAYYRGFYKAKGKGKGAVAAYVAENGPPPSRGGKSFHDRKEDADIVNVEEAWSQPAATSSWSTTSAHSSPSQAPRSSWEAPAR